MPVWTETLEANTAKKVISKNPKRISFSIRNDSGSAVYYGKNRSVSTSGYFQGIKIDPNGGAIEDDSYKGDVYLISASAISVTIVEDVEAVTVPIQKHKIEKVEI
jgi:hypothetical protein